MTWESGQVGVQLGRFGGESLKEEVVGRGLGACIGGVEREWEGTVENISQSSEGGSGCGAVEKEEGGNGLK